MSDNKFKTGKIYKIYNNENDKFYIGSTIKELKVRLSKHKNDLTCMSRKLGVDIKDCIIELIENYPCNSKKELLWRERFYFDKYKLEDNLNFMNKQRPIVTEEERKERIKNHKKGEKSRMTQKIYNSRPDIAFKRKERYKNNKEKISVDKKHYRINNKDKIRQQKKEYREKNKEKIAKIKKLRIECNICNNHILKSDKRRHEKTQTHKTKKNVNEFLTLIDNSLSNINL